LSEEISSFGVSTGAFHIRSLEGYAREIEGEVVKMTRDQLSSQLLTTGAPNISRIGAFADDHLRCPDRYLNVLYQESETVPE
jgi:hypothetical protein